ncbi:MAG TPA: hypothetical protein VK838_02370, partial [Candidatus Limnocylindrales bacterium]|nr:hypothetical protein [Candidatus Limnocylindrales bacterium]
MEVSVPLYPLILVPLAAAGYLFWRRARWHWAVLRAGQPLDRFDRPARRVASVLVYVIGQKRLLQDPVPGLMHAFIFWGFLSLLVTTGNYLTNGLVEAILGWPLGGVLWAIGVGLANLFIALVLAAVLFATWRRVVMRPARLALSRDAFRILGLIVVVVLTELAGDAMRFVAVPADPARDWALLATPVANALEPIGPEAAATWYGAFAWAHILVVLAFGTYLPYSKHLHILTSEPNVYFRNLEPRGALRKMDL